MDDLDKSIIGWGLAGVVTLGTLGAWGSELQQDHRVKELNDITAQACKIPGPANEIKTNVEVGCRISFKIAAQEAEDRDLIDITHDENVYPTIKANFASEASAISKQEYSNALIFRPVEEKLERTIRSLEIDGAYPYANTRIYIDFSALTQIERKDAPPVTSGTWTIHVGDAVGQGSRSFSYDYATGKATGPSGVSNGVGSFNFMYADMLGGGGGHGNFESTTTHQTDLQNCAVANTERACIIANALHETLNGKGANPLNSAERDVLLAYVVSSTRYNEHMKTCPEWFQSATDTDAGACVPKSGSLSSYIFPQVIDYQKRAISFPIANVDLNQQNTLSWNWY